ncbi:hypothetical protein [Micromonospora noduli]|uniref:hypothetical protein n=1 Tax=Micromonospora noduli TaxID=709876 RepID=UPI001788DD2A|nr:hypothetical protein [Micromonospora noduli]
MALIQTGMRLTPALLNPPSAYKTMDETVTSSTTLQDDDHLFVSVVVGAVYDLRLRAFVNSNVTPDFKFGWSYPSGTTITWAVVDVQAGTTAGKRSQSDVEAVASTGASQLLSVDGTVIVGGTGGTLRFRWAQNGSNAAATTVQAGSSLRLERVA